MATQEQSELEMAVQHIYTQNLSDYCKLTGRSASNFAPILIIEFSNFETYEKERDELLLKIYRKMKAIGIEDAIDFTVIPGHCNNGYTLMGYASGLKRKSEQGN